VGRSCCGYKHSNAYGSKRLISSELVPDNGRPRKLLVNRLRGTTSRILTKFAHQQRRLTVAVFSFVFSFALTRVSIRISCILEARRSILTRLTKARRFVFICNVKQCLHDKTRLTNASSSLTYTWPYTSSCSSACALVTILSCSTDLIWEGARTAMA
jgi:hypothetical protein